MCCRPTHDGSLDTFRLDYLIPPVAVLALIFNYKFIPSEILWSFSIWLESVAIFPQLFMLSRTGEAETITTHYLAALALYRGLYIPNWIYRYVMADSDRLTSTLSLERLIVYLVLPDFLAITDTLPKVPMIPSPWLPA